MISRRRFITGVVLALTPLGATASAQEYKAQQARAARIGWLAPESRPDALNPFRQALKELGWVEGGNFAIEQRYTGGNAERYPELAAKLVQLKVDVLVTDGSPATKAAQKATTTIPIVFVSGNPVAQGFVASLSRPGGNLTGISIITGDLNPKRLQLLKEAVPAMTRLAVLQDPSAVGPPALSASWQAIDVASQQLGIQLTAASAERRADALDSAFALAVKERAGGVLVLPSALFSSQAPRIVSLAAKTRLPAIYEHQGFVDVGGLMSYGPSHLDMFRLIATYVDKILKGTKPADLPVEEPTKLKLVINLKTTKALGLTIPQTLLLRADQVIE